MKIIKYFFTVIIMTLLLLSSQATFAGSGAESELPRPELTHPEMFKLHLIKKKFKCGDAELVTESACFDSTDSPDTQCRKQKIKLFNSKKGVTKILPLDGKPVEKNFKESPGPVLDTVVVFCDCLKSKSGTPYILLWYTCRWGRDCCGTNKEWQRIFTVDGTNLTAGFDRHDDDRLDRLYDKFGILDDELHPFDLIYY